LNLFENKIFLRFSLYIFFSSIFYIQMKCQKAYNTEWRLLKRVSIRKHNEQHRAPAATKFRIVSISGYQLGPVTARLLHNIVTWCREPNQNVHKFTRRRITRRFGRTKTERQINTNYHLRLQNYFAYKTTCARFNFDPEYLSLTSVRVR